MVSKETFIEFLKNQYVYQSYVVDSLINTDVFSHHPSDWFRAAIKLFTVKIDDPMWNEIDIEWQKIVGNHFSPQPMSKPGNQSVLPEVIKDLQKREEVGIKKYGTKLKTSNGRSALIDALQESYDLCMYLKQAIMEEEARE